MRFPVQSPSSFIPHSPALGGLRRSTAVATAAAPSSTPQAGSSKTVQIEFRGKVIEGVQEGTVLRTALLLNGASPHNGRASLINCRGLGTCGTCAVRIEEGNVSPKEWTTAERLRLNFPPHSEDNSKQQRLRLACQLTCQPGGPIRVTKLGRFWGQGPGELGPFGDGEGSDAPLGPLEYVLDRKSPGRG